MSNSTTHFLKSVKQMNNLHNLFFFSLKNIFIASFRFYPYLQCDSRFIDVHFQFFFR